MPSSMSALSLEYFTVSVMASFNGHPYDPTVAVVEFAFPPTNGDPVTWFTGGWDVGPIPGTSTYTAKCLVGPGGVVTLAKGQYYAWIRITDSPEIPVRNAGTLTIT